MSKENLENKVEGQENRSGAGNIANYLVGAVALTGAATGVAGADSVIEYVESFKEIPTYAEYIAKTVGGLTTGFVGGITANYISNAKGFRENLYSLL